MARTIANVIGGFLLVLMIYLAAWSNYPPECIPICVAGGGLVLVVGLLLPRKVQ